MQYKVSHGVFKKKIGGAGVAGGGKFLLPAGEVFFRKIFFLAVRDLPGELKNVHPARGPYFSPG